MTAFYRFMAYAASFEAELARKGFNARNYERLREIAAYWGGQAAEYELRGRM